MAGGNRPPGRPKGTPKTGGRQKGTPNKATTEIREWAQKFLADPKGQAMTLQQYREGKLNPTIHQLLYHYAYGKPKETIEHQIPEGVKVFHEYVTDHAPGRDA